MAKSPEQYAAAIAIACLIGTGLSLYSYYVATKLDEDGAYEAMCDISEQISCTKLYTSEYGHGFFGLLTPFIDDSSPLNQPNGVYGAFFYTLVTILGLSKNRTAAKLQVLLLIISNGLSVYLTYLLYLLQDVCVVCVSMYVVNIIALYLAINRHRVLAKQHSTRASSKSSSSGGAAASAASKKKPKPNKRKAKKEK